MNEFKSKIKLYNIYSKSYDCLDVRYHWYPIDNELIIEGIYIDGWEIMAHLSETTVEKIWDELYLQIKNKNIGYE